MKNGLFSRIIGSCNGLVQNCQNLCSTHVPPIQTKALKTTTLLADSGINYDRLVKLRSLIDQTCFEFIVVSYFGALLPQNTPDVVFC